MRILVDLLHPAHVHVFRNLITTMRERGDEVLITAREKDVTIDLLTEYDLDHVVISSQSTGAAGMASEWARRSTKLARIARSFKPDVMTGIMGVSIAPVGRLLRTPSAVFYDTEFATTTNRVVYPLATAVVTPDCYSAPVNGNHIRYPSYHELAYLHPSRFRPDPEVATAVGVDVDTPYSVVRFVSWEASHDRGELALTSDQKRSLVNRLSEHGRVLISSEMPLPDDLEPFAYRGPVSAIHHVISFASLVVGESATMASESAVLGTPSVYIAKTSRGYIDDLEQRYGLVRHFDPNAFDLGVDAASSFMGDNAQQAATRAREQLLIDKVDLTTWMLKFFEQYRRPS
jgi:predicted glycosyltransferase